MRSHTLLATLAGVIVFMLSYCLLAYLLFLVRAATAGAEGGDTSLNALLFYVPFLFAIAAGWATVRAVRRWLDRRSS